MPHIGEKRDRVVKETENRSIKVRITLLFDGTRNNARNTELRLASARNPAARAVVKTFGGGDTSYANDYSNVARLRQTLADTAGGYDFYLRVYVEGIGTANEKADDFWGYFGGSGETGIPIRVSVGIAAALKQLTTLPNVRRESTVISKLTIDTCGFSRGAAAARHCVHRVLDDDLAVPEVGVSPSMARRLQRLGWRVDQIEVRAVGLFDTVSSYVPSWHRASPSGTYSNNVAELHPTAITRAAAVYQIAAANEYRVHFSLTNIDSAVAAGNGHQVFVPGAHSDVGGSYLDNDMEAKVLHWGLGVADVEEFLVQRCWYAKRELKYETTKWLQEIALRGTRGPISSRYSFVTLRMMAHFLRRQQLSFLDALESRFNPGRIPGRDRAEVGASRPEPLEAPDQTLGELRHDFLHISFDESTAFAVRLLPVPRSGGQGYRPWRYIAKG